MYSKELYMWYLGMWFNGGLGSVRSKVGPDDLAGHFQPKQFYDSLKFYHSLETPGLQLSRVNNQLQQEKSKKHNGQSLHFGLG